VKASGATKMGKVVEGGLAVVMKHEAMAEPVASVEVPCRHSDNHIAGLGSHRPSLGSIPHSPTMVLRRQELASTMSIDRIHTSHHLHQLEMVAAWCSSMALRLVEKESVTEVHLQLPVYHIQFRRCSLLS